MAKCLVYDKSLRFSRAVYGLLTLSAFFLRSHWLILAVVVALVCGSVTIKLNLPYQLHIFILKKLGKKVVPPIEKEVAELNFVSGMTGIFLLSSFLLLYFNVLVGVAWALVLITSLLIFLACFAGFCVASLTYALYKKIFSK